MRDCEKPSMKCYSLKFTLISFLFALQSYEALAIDLQPNDARPPPPGISTIQLTYQHSERSDFFKGGIKTDGSGQISSDVYQWRLGHSFTIANQPAYVYANVPMGAVHPQKSLAGLSSDSGLGDTTFLLAYWPYANRETHRYFALGAYLSLPTGSYDKNRYFNVGENVYRTALQAAYQQPIADKLSVMAALDVVWTGDNAEYLYQARQTKLQQSAQYNAQVGLSYALTPVYEVSASYFYTLGAEGTIDGVKQDNAKDIQRYQVFATAKYPIGRFTVQYGSDIKTENGYFEDQRLTLRYLKVF